MNEPRITIIAALAENRVIGSGNDIPWRIQEDSAHFFRTTRRGSLIMGRKTYESIGGKPLPGRMHLVVSRSMPEGPSAEHDTVEVFSSFEAAVARAREIGKEIYISGGAEIYAQGLALADRLVLSYVKGEYEGDTFFPEVDLSEWEQIAREEKDQFTIVEYRRLA